MTPEAKARQQIDQKLEHAGWVIQDMKQLNLGAAFGVVVREYPTDSGPADYVLFVNRNAVGVIEAKKDSAGEHLTVTENQTERYAHANLKWRKDNTPLRFLFEATGQIIRFTDNADPVPRSREIFHFFKPQTLAAWLTQTETLRRRLAEQMPVLPERNLRDCQISAVTGLEQSLAQNKP
ncbi:MAG TPA: restriction endonuclease subunit R, partial [Aquimonas sp.]|nr:restriction endonuclease subunit R [Aquimonas sp.]